MDESSTTRGMPVKVKTEPESGNKLCPQCYYVYSPCPHVPVQIHADS